jgi:TonB family protein
MLAFEEGCVIGVEETNTAQGSIELLPVPIVEVPSQERAQPIAPPVRAQGTDPEPIIDPQQLLAEGRVLGSQLPPDRTFWFALAIVAVLHLGVVVASIRFGIGAPDLDQRGQVENARTVTVELVEAPDAASDLKRSQLGDDTPPAPAQEPQQEVSPQEARSVPETPPEKPPEKIEPPKPETKSVTKPSEKPPPNLEGIDVTMDAYAAAVDAQVARQRQERRDASRPAAERQRVLGAGAQGKQSAYAKSVIAALAKTKPQLSLTKGDVHVAFELTPAGQIKFIKILQSSRDAFIDDLAVSAIQRAKFGVPPPDVEPRDLSYVIHYTFE